MSIIITDNIERECMILISLYRDKEYIKELLPKYYSNISSSKSETVSHEVKSYIVQALNLLQETDDHIITAPLTMYYSIYNFAKAIFYIHYPNLTLASGHGLKHCNSIAKDISEVGRASATVESSGAFRGLIKVTGDSISTGDLFACKEIFSIIPELCGVYANRYFFEPNVYLLREYRNRLGQYDMVFQTDFDMEKRDVDFTLPGVNGLMMVMTSSGCTVHRSEACTQELFDYSTYCDVYGNRYLTSGISNGRELFKISKISALYIVYYIFSMLSRYYPEDWMRLCDSADAAIISKLLIDMRREMLVEVLHYLGDEEYIFETKLSLLDSTLDTRKLWELLKKEMLNDKVRSGKNPLDFLSN